VAAARAAAALRGIFESATAEGTGCKPGTFSATINVEKKTLSMTFYEYVLILSPDERAKSLNCTIKLKVDIPQYVSVAVAQVKYQARAEFPVGMIGRYSAAYAFGDTGTTLPSRTLSEVNGPRYAIFTIEDDVARENRLSWSSCTSKSDLQISTTLSLENSSPAQDGAFAMDFLDAISRDAADRAIISAVRAVATAAPRAPSLEVQLATRACPELARQ
jgi:hypothetical protein